VVQFNQVDLDGLSLASELTSLLYSPKVRVDLSSIGSHLLLLLVGIVAQE
jgi:hypothetical protein